MIRIGVIGTGFGSLVHVPAFREIAGVDIIGIASRDPAHANIAAEKFGIRAFSSWQELIECPDIDAVSVALPAGMHPDVVFAAIAKGKSVLCEKPLALNATDTERMTKAAEKARVIAMVDFEFPEFPAWQKAKEILDNGELGALQSVSIEWMSASWADPGRLWTWNCDREQGGVMRALGIHSLHYLEWFCGPVRSLTADLSVSIVKRPDATGTMHDITAENTANLELRLQSGVMAKVAISNVALDGKGHVLTFTSKRGTLVLKNGNRPGEWETFTLTKVCDNKHCAIEVPTQSDKKYADGRIPAFLSLASRFIQAVEKNNTLVHPSFADGLRAQVLLDAVYASAAKKQWIDIPASFL